MHKALELKRKQRKPKEVARKKAEREVTISLLGGFSVILFIDCYPSQRELIRARERRRKKGEAGRGKSKEEAE